MLSKSNLIVVLAFLVLAVANSADLLNKEIFENFMKARCIENSENNEKALEAYDVIRDSHVTFLTCIQHNINVTEVYIDFFEAYKRDNYTSLFHKYCQKRPVILTCVDSFFKKIAICYDKDLQEIQEMFRKVVVAFMNFLCDDDGAAYIRYIRESSVECVSSNQFSSQLNDCFEKNFDEYFPKDEHRELLHIPRIVLGEKQCNSIWNFENCVIGVLDKCEKKSALEAFQLLLSHIKKEAQYCRNYEIKKNLIENED